MIRNVSPTSNLNVVCNQNNRKNTVKNSDTYSTAPAQFHKTPANLYGVYFTGRFNPINAKREYNNYRMKGLYTGVCTSIENFVYSLHNRERANAKKVNLEGKDLSNYVFKKSGFYKSNLQNTKLINTDFESSNLYGANLRGVKTYNTKFEHTNLADADFAGSEFGNNTIMRGANVIGSDFSNTNAGDVNFKHAIYNRTTVFPREFDPTGEQMILLEDGVNLSNMGERLERAKIRYMNLIDINFDNSSLKRADIKGTWIENSSFKNTELSRAYARETTIKNSDFSGAKMKQINLDGAELTNVNMENADLRGAILTLKKADNVNLKGARYDQFTRFDIGIYGGDPPVLNPEKLGMIKEHSNPGVYGAKTPSEIADVAWEYERDY